MGIPFINIVDVVSILIITSFIYRHENATVEGNETEKKNRNIYEERTIILSWRKYGHTYGYPTRDKYRTDAENLKKRTDR